MLAGLVLLAAGMLQIPQTPGDSPAGFGEPPASLQSPGDEAPERPDPPTEGGIGGRSAEAGRADRSDPAGARPTSDVAMRPARIGDLERPPAPVWMAIDSIGITAPVEAVGITPEGAMTVPGDPGRAGWYRYGPPPGSEAGSSVLTAHVDSRANGAGAFFALRDVQEGAPVTVVNEEDEEITYEVTALADYGKSEVPLDDLFRTHGPPRLVLITCGGEWDEDARSYAENIVVIAEPTS